MDAVLPAQLLVRRRVVETADEAVEVFADAVADGFEGVVVKKLAAPYAAGRRDSGWVKLKPRHTFDLAVIAAEWGYGRREGWLSNLHLAARDSRTGELVMLGKTFKGLTDAVLTWQTEQFLARESRRTKTTVYVDPPLVAEIAIDGIQASTRYPGGIALRFARVIGYRSDKTLDEVDTLDTVIALGAGDDANADADAERDADSDPTPTPTPRHEVSAIATIRTSRLAMHGPHRSVRGRAACDMPPQPTGGSAKLDTPDPGALLGYNWRTRATAAIHQRPQNPNSATVLGASRAQAKASSGSESGSANSSPSSAFFPPAPGAAGVPGGVVGVGTGLAVMVTTTSS